ncbi:MAG: putative penicillin-binding protein [Ilumatobacteraceae bacterium]|nr:putative penicillin-binding protein [Ilumatobacteraceae bacterium]
MRRVSWVFRLVGTVLASALFITGITLAIAPRLWGIANSHDELPTKLPPFEPLAQRSYVYDNSGTQIAIFQQENIQPFTLDQVPPDVIKDVLAVEDKEFYTHDGVNVRSLIRASLSNFSSGATRQGASTITQQVVKNEFLAGLPRDGRYKLLQVHYALMLEKVMTKDQILERYLNTIFFGNNAYGLAAAAETYFGETLSQLTLVQGAFLAGLIRSPSGYDPFREPERARARFEQVLSRLVDEQLITPAESQNYLTTWPIPEVAQTLPGQNNDPTYFTEALQDYLLNKSNILGTDEQQRRSTLLRGGLRIYTTLDHDLQAKAEYSRNALPDNAQGFDASIVSLDTSTGAIRVMVGGKGFKRNVSEVNMSLVPRQTGSSIKIFVLAAALEAGVQPDDLIDGVAPCTLPNPDDPKNPFVISTGESEAVAPLVTMTALSINCAYSRLAQIVGLHRVVDTTYRMAKSDYLYAGQTAAQRGADYIHPYASFATGANEMSPLDMASGAQTIANVGLHHEPYYVEHIDKADGSSFYVHSDPGVQVLDPGVALTEINTLKSVLKSGTGRHYPLADGRPAAGKTGTQEDNTNAWFVGFTPQLTTSVWVGNPNGYIKMNNVPEFVRDGVAKVQGGTYPDKIWKLYMDAALNGQPAEDWAAPPPDARAAARLYLPGNECLGKLVSGTITDPNAPPTTPPPPVTLPDGTPDPNAPPVTAAPLVIQPIDPGTTISPDVLDPHAPVPTIAIAGTVVYDCARAPVGATISGK